MDTFGKEEELKRTYKKSNLDYFGEEPPEKRKDGFGGFIQGIVDYWGEDNFIKSTWRAVFGEVGQESSEPSISDVSESDKPAFYGDSQEQPAPGVVPFKTPGGERYTLPSYLSPENRNELRDIMENR